MTRRLKFVVADDDRDTREYLIFPDDWLVVPTTKSATIS